MKNRYLKTQVYINVDENYETFLKNKKINKLTHYSTFNFSDFENLKSSKQIYTFLHVFQPFDKLSLISQKYYNSPDLGWFICYTNGIANETLIKIGTPLTIYGPPEQVLGVL